MAEHSCPCVLVRGPLPGQEWPQLRPLWRCQVAADVAVGHGRGAQSAWQPVLGREPALSLSPGSTAITMTFINLLSCCCAPCTVPISFHQRYNPRRRVLLLTSFCRWGNRSSGSINNFPGLQRKQVVRLKFRFLTLKLVLLTILHY